MRWAERHSYTPDTRFDGGSLDCGNGLLLLIRKHLDPLQRGQLLEILSTDSTVEVDLPAWARLTSNELVSVTRSGEVRSFLICKGKLSERDASSVPASVSPPSPAVSPAVTSVPEVTAVPSIAPLSVMGVGSWPRPAWLLRALHERLEGRLSETDFEATASDAVRLAVAGQERAGVDVVTDGEQRRDNYASFVGARLDNCQLIPITDLLPYVDDPDKFAEELRGLDVPADQVRHPAVFGPIRRGRSLAVHELDFARRITQRPVKVALPGPYLLTRTMWLECVSDKAYASREQLAADVVQVLRDEVRELLAHGAAIVQFDEPVLTEVVFSSTRQGRSFMCGALGERRDPEPELEFAGGLIRAVLEGFPRERLALHVCRGNWSRDESVALAGDYRPLLPLFRTLPVGTFFLELCTPRAGELAVLRDLPSEARLGLGVVNQKLDAVEPMEKVLHRVETAIDLFGAERLLLNPDCGFATFADNPLASAEVAEAKLSSIVAASRQLREKYGLPSF